MGKVLKFNVTLRRSMNAYPETFKAGEELPDELTHLVGEHVFTGKATDKIAKVEKTKTAKPKVSREAEKTEQPKPEDVVPKKSASKALWEKFAKSKGVSLPDDAGRDDIVELVYAKFPELAE